MKPNVLFITIDSLRADKIYGNSKTSKTPNIDLLIKTGTYFSQTISSSDATGTCLGSVFTSLYPFESGITHFKFDSNTTTHFDILKKSGYNIYATVPDLSFFLKITPNFDDKDLYVYDKRDAWVGLFGGIGEQIIDRLVSKMKEPWVYHIHLMDLHAPFFIPKKFDSPQYGDTRYDRMVSAIDVWIGRILEKINLNNTLVILSADHGDYIPINDYDIHSISHIQQKLRRLKQLFPFLEPIGLKLFILLKHLIKSYRILKLKQTLTEQEIRTIRNRGQGYLYDELIHIPLIFTGYGVPNNKIISDQVRQIDIFPTISEILGISDNQNKMHARSLVSFFQDKTLKKIPTFIESGSRNPKKSGSVVGIRTEQYKYLRSRDDSKKNISLFDLKLDPSEHNDISKLKPDVIKEMEEILTEITKNSIKTELTSMTDEETKKIEEELRKLGYM